MLDLLKSSSFGNASIYDIILGLLQTLRLYRIFHHPGLDIIRAKMAYRS